MVSGSYIALPTTLGPSHDYEADIFFVVGTSDLSNVQVRVTIFRTNRPDQKR